MKTKIFIGSLVTAALLGGCSVGDAPSGPTTPEAVMNAASQLSPQEQIRIVQTSPASAAKKAELIKALEDKYHVKADAPSMSTPSQSSAPPPAGN